MRTNAQSAVVTLLRVIEEAREAQGGDGTTIWENYKQSLLDLSSAIHRFTLDRAMSIERPAKRRKSTGGPNTPEQEKGGE